MAVLSPYHKLFDLMKHLDEKSLKILLTLVVFCFLKFMVGLFYEVFKILRQCLVTSLFYEKDFATKYNGEWVIVTGASEGLGRGYAFELARRKMNVILISRSLDKLQKTAAGIQNIYDVKTVCIPFDLCLLKDNTHYQNLENQLKKYDISILVNNAAYQTKTMQPFLEMEKPEVLMMQDLNMGALTLLTHMILPRLLQKRNGAIINVSSLTSIHPTPYVSMYSATKIYVDYLTDCLAYEYKGRGITFQHYNPGYIKTQMTNYADFFGFVVDPITCADSSLRNLGVSTATPGHFFHQASLLFAILVPAWLWKHLMEFHNVVWTFLTGRAVKYGKEK